MSLLDKASLIQIPSGYKNGKLYSVKPTPTYGSEQISNGDFTNGSTSWTVSNGTVTDKYNASMTAYQNGIKISTFSLSGTYKLIFDLTITSGNCKFDGGGSNSQTYTTSGRKELTITNPTKFEFNAFNLGWVGTLDNVSVKEVLVADGDFTFSRSSSATRVNSEGLIETAQIISTTELVTNGDFASSSNWNGVNANGVTISNGTLNYSETPNGTNITQSSVVEIGKRYKVTFTISNYVKGGILVVLGAGGTTQEVSSNGTFNLYGVASINTTLYIQARGASGTTLSIDNVSVKEVIENDVPRLDYSDGSCACLLLEPQSTNTITYSENFSQWNQASTPTLTSGQLAPDGTLGATKISGTIGSSYIYLSSTTSTTATRSIYARTVSGTGTAKLMSHNSNTNNLFTLTEEWQRFELTTSNSSGGTNFYVDLRDSSQTLSEFIIWGAQSEALSYATSYIPSNSGSQTTRTADVCNNAGTSATFNSTEGVLFAEIAALADDSTYRQISLSDGTATNRISLFYQNTSNQIAVESAGSGTNLGIYNQNLTITNSNKIAVKYKVNDCALWINGVEVATDTSFAAFSSGTFTELSFDKGDGSLDFYGKCKQLMVFDEALSDSELAELTTL